MVLQINNATRDANDVVSNVTPPAFIAPPTDNPETQFLEQQMAQQQAFQGQLAAALRQNLEAQQPFVRQVGQQVTDQGMQMAQERARVSELQNRQNRAARGQLGGSQDATSRARSGGQLSADAAQAGIAGQQATQGLEQQAQLQNQQQLLQAFQNPFLQASAQAQLRGLGAEQQGLAALQGIDQNAINANVQNLNAQQGAFTNLNNIMMQGFDAQRQANAQLGQVFGNALSGFGNSLMIGNNLGLFNRTPTPVIQNPTGAGAPMGGGIPQF